MLLLRLGAGVILAYAALLLAGWLLQDRLAFPAPRAEVPDPRALGIPDGERIALSLDDGTRLAGWYLPPRGAGPGARPRAPAPALLWFYGNGETIASIGRIVRDFQPPGAALLVVDYPGYGGSAGRATEAALYAAADAAYAALVGRPEVDARRVYLYGRSLGSAVATHAAARHPAAGLILESPFTSARDMARLHYAIFPRFILRIQLDNLATLRAVRCPMLIFHGTADRLVPLDMARRLAAAASGPVRLEPIPGAGHNDTFEVGGEAYRERLAAFVLNSDVRSP
jgi:fermentation-respiration switch protein FrsA (DUF1100 family)